MIITRFKIFQTSKTYAALCGACAVLFLVGCGTSTNIAPVYREGSNVQRNAHLNPSGKVSEKIKGPISKKKAQRIIRSSNFEGLDPLEQHRIAKASVDPNNHRPNKRFITNAPDVVRAKRAPVKEARIASNGVPIPEAKPRGTSPSISVKAPLVAAKPAFSAGASAPVPVRRPSAKRAAHVAVPQIKVVNSFSNKVTAIRFGNSDGKSRVVLDLQKMGTYNISLDPTKRFVRVALNGMSWSAKASVTYNNHPLIKSYRAVPNTQGTSLVIELKRPARLMSNNVLPRSGNSRDRIFFDIAPL